MSRNAYGEGTIYRRKDGRMAGSLYVTTVEGRRKRITVYGTTRTQVVDQLSQRREGERRGIPTPDQSLSLASFIEHWLTSVAAVKCRPRTLEYYRRVLTLHVLPDLGPKKLRALTARDVQGLLKRHQAAGMSTRMLHAVRSILRAALSQAEREELISRNVAKLTELPPWRRKAITPWTTEDASRFLAAAESHRWYGGFAMLLFYGMRRGEVLGLRWGDVDLDTGVLRIENQLQRIDGKLSVGPVKTDAGRRQLPIVPVVATRLRAMQEREPAQPNDMVFTSSTGTPIDPKNFVRTFHEIRVKAGLRRITVHHLRHTAATMLKDLGIPARDAQLILGHAHVSTTQQLYQHGDIRRQTIALGRLAQRLTADIAVNTAVINELSTGQDTNFMPLTSGGPSGDRTHDTLLKSFIRALGDEASTSVLERVRTRANVQIVGHIAVKHCCQSRESGHRLSELLTLRDLGKAVQVHQLRLRCFPLSLLPVYHA